ncbi:WXG100 family type VII secretion target [Paenibacillus solani]|uniref:Type VII secretion protein n=1 Tax=Paenibacillus solani TaxID=1705565 RepID=A0A0M1P698_9BACL|nr:WXG100 family type VII secretion target [Paenibacillus solani]KOR89825.1 type VII secretion protein [Paenibacillus solani]
MSNRILVTPEQLEQVSSQFAQSGQLSSDMVQQLQRSIHELESQWQGMTRERFYGEYQQARSTMLKFVECLQSISTELNQISVKFRTTDEQVNGAVVGGAAAGAAVLAGSAGSGAVPAAGVKAPKGPAVDPKTILDKAIEGYEVEGSVVGNKENGLYANAINGKASASLVEGVEVGGSIVEAGFDNDYANGSVSLMNAEVEASVKDGTLSVGAEGTITKYEGGFKIPLPWTDKSLNIGGSASLGVVGGSAEVGKNGLSFHIPLGPGISLFGLGGSVSVK